MMDGEGDGGGVLRKKVVLLGPQSTGKSTFFRALGYLYGCVEGAQNRYGTMHSDGSVLKLRASVVNLFVSLNIQKPGLLPPDILECLGSLDTSTFSKLYDLLKNDPAVKSILTNYHELGLHLTPLASFVSSSDLLWRLSQHSPLTTIWEVLSSGIPSTGIHTWEMDIEGSGVLVLDVGGTPPQRKKWIHCYDDVSAVLFFVSLTSYDELTADSLPQLDDAASLLASVSKSEPLREKPIFLLLSMLDQFKLKRISVPVNLDWPPAEFSLCYSMPSAVRATIVYPPQPGVLCTSELSSAFPLWSEIFEWLDMFDLCKMRLVCRTWKNVSDQHRRGWRRHCEALCMKPINTRSLAERHSAYSALVQTECEEKIACIVVFHWQPDVKRILWALTRNLECNQLQRVHPILLNNTNLSDVGMATGLVCDRCQFLDRVNSMSGKTINWDSIADNYYDILADKVSAIDLPFWKRMAREACTSCGNNQILEVMAGTGRVSIPLAIDGAAAHRVVVAVDYCNSMLRKLSEKATNVSPRGIIETMYQDARKLDLGERKFKIRTCIYCFE
ncbi:hypothetical protein Pelo_7102 [Pelomyxa schiedti]|nr:hypothetical protein Pelo_7102 [Pelomyxa schiedti]